MKTLLITFIVCLLAINNGISQQTFPIDSLLDTLLDHSIPEIKVSQLSFELQRNNSLVVLDAREKKEFKISHIENAIFVGYEDFSINRVKQIPKESKVIVYCSVGYRSEKVAEHLKSAGYENVYNLYGGIFEWMNLEYPVYNIDLKETDKVHPYSEEWGVWLKNGEKVYDE